MKALNASGYNFFSDSGDYYAIHGNSFALQNHCIFAEDIEMCKIMCRYATEIRNGESRLDKAIVYGIKHLT